MYYNALQYTTIYYYVHSSAVLSLLSHHIFMRYNVYIQLIIQNSHLCYHNDIINGEMFHISEI